MKPTVTIIRILTGLLFIFSGLVKAIDPLGLAYKMQEFFEVWGQNSSLKSLMDMLDHYAVAFSIIMITLEVVVGLALLLGWQKKLTAWILLLLMLFFTFLTSFVLFTGKIRACGCFGDCIPLTPIQTFTKDIVLLLFAFFILFNTEYIRPLAKPMLNTICVFVAAMLTLWLQFHVMKHLPLVDCLPFKKGNNILELRKMPADAVQDKYDYVFTYEKNGTKKEFPLAGGLPDSTWNYVDRKQILVEKGKNNIPLINDFTLTTEDGIDSTETILSQPGEYYLVFIKELPDNSKEWLANLKSLSDTKGTRKMYVITAQKNMVRTFLDKNMITVDRLFGCDVTSIKTASRATPTIYLMRGPIVQGKWGWADFDEIKK